MFDSRCVALVYLLRYRGDKDASLQVEGYQSFPN